MPKTAAGSVTPEIIAGGTTFAPQVIADEIVSLAAAMALLNSTRLKRDAIVTLIHANSKIGKKTIELILNNLEGLEETWLKPETHLAYRFERELKMSEKQNVYRSGGISFAGVLTVLFIGLKLAGIITWSWLWVLAPLWIGFVIGGLILACVVGGLLFAGLIWLCASAGARRQIW